MKSKANKSSVKEIKFRPHRYWRLQYKIKEDKVYSGGDKTKISVRFRGREILNSDLGLELLNKVKQELKDIAQVDQEASLEEDSL